MRVQDQPVYVLHRRPWRDNSLVLDVLTLHHGRLSVIAKGALSSKRNAGAWMQTCQPLIIGWSGRSALKTLTEFETPASSVALQGERLFCGFYLSELVLALLPEHEAYPEVFHAYAQALESLYIQDELSVVLRRFELVLLQNIGLAPDFGRDTLKQPISADVFYWLDMEEGFRVWWPPDAAPHAQPLPTQVFHGRTLQALVALLDSAPMTTARIEMPKEAKRLMRLLIDAALQGRTLHSRALFKQLNAAQAKQKNAGTKPFTEE